MSREQPAAAQPVAAGPAKVGVNCPRLADEDCPALETATALDCPLEARDKEVAAAPEVVVSSAAGRDSSESTAAAPRRRLFLLFGINPPLRGNAPPGTAMQNAGSPAPGGPCGKVQAAARGDPGGRHGWRRYHPAGGTIRQSPPSTMWPSRRLPTSPAGSQIVLIRSVRVAARDHRVTWMASSGRVRRPGPQSRTAPRRARAPARPGQRTPPSRRR